MSEDNVRDVPVEVGEEALSERTPEEQSDNDRSTVWYCLGTGDMRILRMTLMDQEEETLDLWYAQADTLRRELVRMKQWLASAPEEVRPHIDPDS